MSAQLKIDHASVARNNDVGRFTGILTGLSNLKRNQFLESGIVEIGGFAWMLGVKPDCQGDVLDMLQIYLFSCNDFTIHANVGLSVLWQNQTGDYTTTGKPTTAIPFHSIVTKTFDPYELAGSNGSGLDGNTLHITADFRNIKKADKSEETKAKENAHTITLGVIDNFSIRETLNQGSETTIILTQHKRYSDLCSGSLVRLWARQDLDCRYWLCKYREDGNVSICECLNDAPVFKEFGEICAPKDDGHLWVTVFQEKKESNESFESFDDDTILVFCMVWNPLFKDLSSYLGHLLVKKTIAFYKLSGSLADMAGISDSEDFSVHVYNGTSRAFKPSSRSTVTECGVRSGSVCIVEKLSKNQGPHSEGSSDLQNLSRPPSDRLPNEGEDCEDRPLGENADCPPVSPPTTEAQPTPTQTNVPSGSNQNAPAVTTEADSRGTACQSPDPSLNEIRKDVPENTEAAVKAQTAVAGDSVAQKSNEEIAGENPHQRPESKELEGHTPSDLIAEAKQQEQEHCQEILSSGLHQSLSNEYTSGIQSANGDKAQQLRTNTSTSIYVKVVIDDSKAIVNQEHDFHNPKMMDPVSTDTSSQLNDKNTSSGVLHHTSGNECISG